MPTQNKQQPYRFGEKLRTVREKKGYTLKVVAQKAGVSESLVSQIERNRVSPAIDTLLTLADVLDINLEFLFEEYRRDKPVKIIRKDERRKVEEEDVLYQELAKPSEEIDSDLVDRILDALDAPEPTPEQVEASWRTIKERFAEQRG